MVLLRTALNGGLLPNGGLPDGRLYQQILRVATSILFTSKKIIARTNSTGGCTW